MFDLEFLNLNDQDDDDQDDEDDEDDDDDDEADSDDDDLVGRSKQKSIDLQNDDELNDRAISLAMQRSLNPNQAQPEQKQERRIDIFGDGSGSGGGSNSSSSTYPISTTQASVEWNLWICKINPKLFDFHKIAHQGLIPMGLIERIAPFCLPGCHGSRCSSEAVLHYQSTYFINLGLQDCVKAMVKISNCLKNAEILQKVTREELNTFYKGYDER